MSCVYRTHRNSESNKRHGQTITYDNNHHLRTPVITQRSDNKTDYSVTKHQSRKKTLGKNEVSDTHDRHRNGEATELPCPPRYRGRLSVMRAVHEDVYGCDSDIRGIDEVHVVRGNTLGRLLKRSSEVTLV